MKKQTKMKKIMKITKIATMIKIKIARMTKIKTKIQNQTTTKKIKEQEINYKAVIQMDNQVIINLHNHHNLESHINKELLPKLFHLHNRRICEVLHRVISYQIDLDTNC